MERKYGYCCINLSVSEDLAKKNRITANRSMTKKTFIDKGINYVSELALLNVTDLFYILEWNHANKVMMYRMSSDMFPWMSEYEIKDLPDFEAIEQKLKECGDFSKKTGQRLTFHPSPYGVIASLDSSVVRNAIKELSQHGEIMDIMGLDRSLYYPINIHVNTTKPSKIEAAERFCENFTKLPESVKSRLVVEIDDKKSQYTSIDLFELVYKKIKIPITFDYLHNLCNPPEKLSEKESLEICLSTWPKNVVPIVHYSESRKIYENQECRENAHSDWVYNEVSTYNLDFSIEFEVKMKEKALLKYLKDFIN